MGGCWTVGTRQNYLRMELAWLESSFGGVYRASSVGARTVAPLGAWQWISMAMGVAVDA